MAEYLGVDTSNYTTSVAVCSETDVALNVKRLLDVPQGEKGLRQSDALFSHVKRLPEIFSSVNGHRFSAVGVSDRPRNAEGSYMPCFLAGLSASSAAAAAAGIPLYRFSHQQGHVAAALFSCGREDLHAKEFLAFHLSGGTTELLHVSSGKIEIIGRTLDISAGQAIDRAGVAMGLHFPCGAELEKIMGDAPLAKTGKIRLKGLDCNLSGLENKTRDRLRMGASPQEIAAYVFSFVAETVSAMTEAALREYPSLPVVYSGGVMSNAKIKSLLGERFGGLFAEPQYSSDNAAGIARLTYFTHEKIYSFPGL